MSSPGQLESPDTAASDRAAPSELNSRPSAKDKTDQTFMRVSFGRYVTQIVSTGQREAHERRLKRLQDEARELHKNEWMFTPVDRLLGNWVE